MTWRSIIPLLSLISLFPLTLTEPIPHQQKHALVFDEAGTLRAVQNHPHFIGKREVSSRAEITNGTFYLVRRADSNTLIGETCSNIDVSGPESDIGDDIPATDSPGSESDTDDKTPVDITAGLGVEFETDAVYAKWDENIAGCDRDDWEDSKGRAWANHAGEVWTLTGDTTNEPFLSAEYIINGKTCKIGQNKAVPAAEEIAEDIRNWSPSRGQAIEVIGSSCVNGWTIWKPEAELDLATVASWAAQITSGMPLEAIYDIIKDSGARVTANPLMTGTFSIRNRFTYVTKEFLESRPNGLDPDNVDNDVLGFLSLIVSYAKNARAMGGTSPKTLLSIMPRTDFIGLYRQVQDRLQPGLHNLVKVLACYQYFFEDDYTDIDGKFCSPPDGDGGAPRPNGQMDLQKFQVKDEELLVSDWINSIEEDNSPDKLTDLDEAVDKSIGHFRLNLEQVYGGSTRQVPIFEFRDLGGFSASGMSRLVDLTERYVMAKHLQYQNVPS